MAISAGKVGGPEKTFWGNGYVHFDCCDSSCVSISSIIKLHFKNMQIKNEQFVNKDSLKI